MADPPGGAARGRQRRALWAAFGVNGAYLVVEVVAGLAFGSLALLADAAHMVSDVVALGVAGAAQSLLDRPASARHTYGLQRAEVLAAQVNGVLLLAAGGWVVYEAIRRIDDPSAVAGGGLLLVATVGLAINLGSAVALSRTKGESLNMRGAYLHMVLDALGSIAAMTAGAAALLWDAHWVDPAASLVIGAFVLWSAWRLLRDATRVLMEGAPRGLDAGDVEAALLEGERVEAVHHVHLWNLASDVPAMSGHVVLEGEVSLHDAQEVGEELKERLRARFGIGHATLELECHACEPAASEVARR